MHKKQKLKTRKLPRNAIEELKCQAKFKWLEILGDLAPQLAEAIENAGNPVPCPVHGRTDQFRFYDDVAETGGGVCNSCKPKSDGLAVLMWFNDWTFPQAVEAVSTWLNKNGANLSAPLRPTGGATASVDPTVKKMLDKISEGLIRDTGCIAEYLQSQGLSGKVPDVIKLHPNLPFYEDTKLVGYFPTMVAPLQRLDGQIVAYQLVYLHPEEQGEYPVRCPKILTPRLWEGAQWGAAIRLGEIGEVLGIAGGLETALAIQDSTGMPVWAAGPNKNLEAIALPKEVKTVYIWPHHGRIGWEQGAVLNLKQRLLMEGYEVFVVTPPEAKTDWRGVLAQKGKDALCEAWLNAKSCKLDSEPDNDPDDSPCASDEGEKDIERIIAELNQKHFVVNIGGRTCIANLDYDPQMQREDLSFSTPADFRLRYSNRKLNDTYIADTWLESPHRAQYKGVIFAPGKTVPGYFNLFKGFPVEPVPGDCSLFWTHLRENICSGNIEHFHFVKGWMAHAIQRPQELPGTAIVLRGQQGTGKGIFVEMFGKLFGNHFLTVYNLEQVTGRFNSHIKNVLLLHANEVVCKDDKVGEGVLKGLITDPTVPIEYKGKDIITVPNFKRLIFATNEDWAAPLGMDDRRYLVLDVNPARKEDGAYFKAIIEQMKNRGLEALMYELQTEDLSNFDVRSIPFSKSNFEQKLYTAPPIVQWWYETLVDGCNSDGYSEESWCLEVAHDKLFGLFVDWCNRARKHPATPIEFGRKLRNLLPGIELRETRRTVPASALCENQKGKGRTRSYVFPELQVCREAFQRFSKTGSEIWEEYQEA